MAHIEALLAYSSAEIVTRIATGQNETWLVEGLIQPGLRCARFTFKNNGLTEVDLQCQYAAWSSDRYRDRVEELRKFFDRRFGENHRSTPTGSATDSAQQNGPAYLWRLENTSLTVLARLALAPAPQRLAVSSLIFKYRADATTSEPDGFAITPESWGDNVLSPVVRQKLQPSAGQAPGNSNLTITNCKLLNATDTNQTAYVLQVAVTLEPEVMIDPTKSLVEVNFYDTLPTGELVLTDANVAYNWRSNRDWKFTNPENVSVSYIRKSGDKAATSSARRFFGYVATVYYDGRLESLRAEPIGLINLFPVRTFLSAFENAQNAAARGDYVTAANLYKRAADQ